MPDTIEDLTEEIKTASEPGYRGRLVARGLARGLLWSDGVLPPGAPAFSETLDSDLRGYGYGLAHLALRLKEDGGPRDLYEQGLQKAAEALEAVVRKGDRRVPSRGLDTTAGAAMYHLAHYGARAYSLIGGDLDQLNLAPFERLLCHLLRHDLDGVRTTGAAAVADPEGQDSRIAAKFRDDTNEYDFADAVAAVVTSGLAAALLRFEFALSRGDLRIAEEAKEDVRRAEEFAKAANHPTAWWILRLARHVLGELWENSAHVILPEDDPGDWNALRRRYLAILSGRPTSEIILWPSQRAAASRATDDSDDLVVSLPTSAGKTRIAELCILRALSKGRRAVYVTPLRALSAQVERSLTSTFSPLGYSVSSLYGASGATSFDRDTLANRDIVVSTPEKLDFAIRSQPDLLDDVGVVVLDEGHMIGLDEREIRYEVLLQRLLRRADAHERRLVCLSAVLPEGKHLDHFVAWIRQDEPGEPVRESWRPTRQMFGRVSWRNGSARLDLEVEGETPFLNAFIEPQSPTGRRQKIFPGDQAELVLATAWRLARDGHQVLVFAPQKRSVNSLANAVLKLHRQGLLSALGAPNVRDAVAAGNEWLGSGHAAVKCLELAVGVHHGSLPQAFRRQVESLMRAKGLPVVIASPTLAQGMNMGASAIVVHSLHRNGQVIKAQEFENVIGRAGRAFVDIDGIILRPMYEPTPQRRREWKTLVEAVGQRKLRSGLLALVEALLDKLHQHVGGDFDTLKEYVLGQTIPLSFHPEEADENRLEVWPVALELLDEALLATIDPLDTEVESLPAVLDEVLRGSLWARWLAEEPEEKQHLHRQALIARASWIWENNTETDRRGYYAAGLGVSSGQYLRDNAERLYELLVASEAALEAHDDDQAVASIVALYEVVSVARPFAPRDSRDDASQVLAAWLSGDSVADLNATFGEGTQDYVEDAFVYRLTWAMEAVRTTAVAREHAAGDVIHGTAAAAVASGLLDPRGILMLQVGMESRLCAVEALARNPVDFTSIVELRTWVDSCPDDSDWPTAALAWAWQSFVEKLRDSWSGPLVHRAGELDVDWEGEVPPPGTPVRLDPQDTTVRDPAMRVLGRLAQALPAETRSIIDAKVGRSGSVVEYETFQCSVST